MADPIPNLYKKYGGPPLLTSVVKEITTANYQIFAALL
jgi:hypothetical protein